MKALTVSQPFASLIASGDKWVENRGWGTTYRGPLAIHAGKGTQYLDRADLAGYPTGCVVAISALAACIPIGGLQRLSPKRLVLPSGKTVEEILGHKHTEGPWCWILADVQRLEPPIRCAGKVGLWDWDVSTLCVSARLVIGDEP